MKIAPPGGLALSKVMSQGRIRLPALERVGIAGRRQPELDVRFALIIDLFGIFDILYK